MQGSTGWRKCRRNEDKVLNISKVIRNERKTKSEERALIFSGVPLVKGVAGSFPQPDSQPPGYLAYTLK